MQEKRAKKDEHSTLFKELNIFQETLKKPRFQLVAVKNTEQYMQQNEFPQLKLF